MKMKPLLLPDTPPKPVRVIAVTSGKGGVGKTQVAMNLAIAMAMDGKKVMLLDADLGLANIDVMLGLQPKYNLSHVIQGERTLAEVILTGPAGLKIIPAAPGLKHMAGLLPMEHAGLIRAFSEVSHDLDVLIIDTASGVSDSVISFTLAAQEVMVVVCDEPASITGACALMRLLRKDHGVRNFHLLANMAKDTRAGRELFEKVGRITDGSLDVSLNYMGLVPFDPYLRKAVQKQCAVLTAYPRSRAARAFKNLAQLAAHWPLPQQARGHLEFFVERLIHPTHIDSRLVI